MPLSAGARLGPYEVVCPLGAGGMGEVYKARDTRLDRTVAIKILAPSLADDPDLRARFEGEARAVAALDHPHICGIYDVGDADGTHFLVMPYLEGQTLAARLEKGRLPVEQALKVATEIADALEKAHRRGVVHRDLKPANIMLTKAGSKLLDFGLAKLKAPAGPVSLSRITGLATTTPGTSPGTILGTVQYMAPEQVEGKDADARSDIWALGGVLYEMITGTRPFGGDSPGSVIGAILRDHPPPISTRQPLAPPALDHVVETCLAKDPDARWQSAGDVGRQLAWIAASGTPGAAARAASRNPWRERSVWILATALLASLLFSLRWRGPIDVTDDAVRLSIYPPTGTVFSGNPNATVPAPQFALSPDGRSVVFVTASPGLKPTLWVRPLQDVDARQLPGTDDAYEPFWSPDGRWVAFFAQGQLKKVPAAGGPVQVVADGVAEPRGASWGSDDTILFGTGFSAVYQVAAAGGTATPVTELDSSKQEGSHRWPQFLPDGRHFLFTARSGLAEQRGVYVGSLTDKTRHFLVRSDANASYVSPGYLLFLEGDTVLARSFDVDRFELTGQPMTIAAKVGRSSNGNGAFFASHDTLMYSGSMLQPGRLAWFDRKGNRLDSVGPEGYYSDFRLSPDEKRLAASLVDPALGIPDIWLTDFVRGGTSQFTFGPGFNAAPVWSPDAERIAFRNNRKGLVEFYLKSAAGGGSEEPLMLEEAQRAAGLTSTTLFLSDWSSDGRHIAFSANLPSDLWLLQPADQKVVNMLRSRFDQSHANFSPDVKLIAYSSNESGRFEVYVQTFPLSDRKWPISTNGGSEPRWRGDGGEIYYLSEDGTLMAVTVAPGASLFGAPRKLFQTSVQEAAHALRTHYVPSRDGSRFLVFTQSGDPPPVPITVVLNWRAGLNN